MNILIDNAGFVNKGAELMLYAAQSQALLLFPNSKVIVRPEVSFVSKEEIIRKGFYYMSKPKSKGRFIPNKYTQLMGFINPSNIDLVLDAGGFQFSDQFINYYTESSNQALTEYYKMLRKGGAKIVFLPQAFGPFTLPLAIEKIKIAFKAADIIYARDPTSLSHLKALFGNSEKIKLARDFTNLYEPDVPLASLLSRGTHVGIIPNQRMVTHTKSNISGAYLDYLTSLCQKLIENGEKIILLNHEGKGDYDIIRQIKERLSSDIIVLNDLNANEVKAVIGRLKLLISSRFHGVVSGLSQGVISFCTGWSHKYHELLKDYDVENNLLDMSDVQASYEIVMDAMKSNTYSQKEQIIISLKQDVQNMWNEIKLFIDNNLNRQ